VDRGRPEGLRAEIARRVNARPSPCVAAVGQRASDEDGGTRALLAWGLEETGLPCRVHALDHTAGELDGDACSRISPFRQAPVIDDDGFVVAESAAVVLYLAEKAGKLIPGDVQARTRVVQWCFAAVGTVEPTLVCIDTIDIFGKGEVHLEHRLVQRLLGRFVAQGFVLDDLARACVGQTDDAVPRVLLLGRLSLYGDRAARLHDEVVSGGACAYQTNAVCVGAVKHDLSMWSNTVTANPFGSDREEPDVVALGGDNATCGNTVHAMKANTSALDDWTGFFNATSAATPVVTSMMALTREYCVGLGRGFSPRWTRAILKASLGANPTGWRYETPGKTPTAKDGAGFMYAEDVKSWCSPGDSKESGDAPIDLAGGGPGPSGTPPPREPPIGPFNVKPLSGANPGPSDGRKYQALKTFSFNKNARLRAVISWDACATAPVASQPVRVVPDFDLFLHTPNRGGKYVFSSQSVSDNSEGFDIDIHPRARGGRSTRPRPPSSDCSAPAAGGSRSERGATRGDSGDDDVEVSDDEASALFLRSLEVLGGGRAVLGSETEVWVNPMTIIHQGSAEVLRGRLRRELRPESAVPGLHVGGPRRADGREIAAVGPMAPQPVGQ
jgi:hypothetical protein